MEDDQSVEFAVKVVYHCQIYSDELTIFSLRRKKGRTLFSTKRSAVVRKVI